MWEELKRSWLAGHTGGISGEPGRYHGEGSFKDFKMSDLLDKDKWVKEQKLDHRGKPMFDRAGNPMMATYYTGGKKGKEAKEAVKEIKQAPAPKRIGGSGYQQWDEGAEDSVMRSSPEESWQALQDGAEQAAAIRAATPRSPSMVRPPFQWPKMPSGGRAWQLPRLPYRDHIQRMPRMPSQPQLGRGGKVAPGGSWRFVNPEGRGRLPMTVDPRGRVMPGLPPAIDEINRYPRSRIQRTVTPRGWGQPDIPERVPPRINPRGWGQPDIPERVPPRVSPRGWGQPDIPDRAPPRVSPRGWSQPDVPDRAPPRVSPRGWSQSDVPDRAPPRVNPRSWRQPDVSSRTPPKTEPKISARGWGELGKYIDEIMKVAKGGAKAASPVGLALAALLHSEDVGAADDTSGPLYNFQAAQAMRDKYGDYTGEPTPMMYRNLPSTQDERDVGPISSIMRRLLDILYPD